MALPPKNTQVNREDLGDAPKWVEKLLETLNPLARSSSAALTRGLTFKENFLAEVKDITFVAPEPVWRTPTALSNSWVNGGGSDALASYRIDPFGRTWIRGVVTGGVIGAAVIPLPLGYRPEVNINVPVISNSALGYLAVVTNGNVIAQSGSNAWFTLDCSFQATAPALPDAPTGNGWPISVSHSLPEVSGVIPVMCRAENLQLAQSNGIPTLDWDVAGPGAIRLKAVWGLTPGKRYTMRLLLFAR